MKGFYGVYSRKNRALMTVVDAIKNGKRPRKQSRDPRRQEALLQVEVAYKERVRQLSSANLKTFPEAVNPKSHKIGPSGVQGHHHLDHCVPVSWCWNYLVPEVVAASVENLQVIPWRVNHARNTNFRPDMMIGAPRRLFTDQELRLLSQWYYGSPGIRRRESLSLGRASWI
jgi:hypothetical protein